MADLRTEAQRVLEEAREAIAWIAFWKNGRSWNAVAFWPEVDEGVPKWDSTEVELLRKILKQDENAIVVNAYYHNLGDTETMTRESLAAALRQQYEWQSSKISETLETSKGDNKMKFLQTADGYDIYELSADECKKNFRTFPLFCCFHAGTEPVDRDLALSENEAETLAEMLDWCKQYSRDSILNLPAKEPAASSFPEASKLYEAWALDQNFKKIPLFAFIAGDELDAWLQKNCDNSRYYGQWWIDVSTEQKAKAAGLPYHPQGLLIKFQEITPGDLFVRNGCAHELTAAAAKKSFSVTTTVTAKEIESIIVDGLEGCCNYWLGVDNSTLEWKNKPQGLPVSQYAAALILTGKPVKLYDVEDDSQTWELTLEKLLEGIGQYMSTRGKSTYDAADDPDTTIQLALFGEVVYG